MTRTEALALYGLTVTDDFSAAELAAVNAYHSTDVQRHKFKDGFMGELYLAVDSHLYFTTEDVTDVELEKLA